jgi:hypothetical protein
MPPATWPPTPTPAEQLAALSPAERLLGYEVLLEHVISDLGAAPSDCLRSSRQTEAGRVPSVLAVLEDRVVEFWLVGTAVRRAEVQRPVDA